MINLSVLFTELPETELNNDALNVLHIPLFSNHRIGKSETGQPMLFVYSKPNKRAHYFPNIKLQNFSVFFNATCHIITSGQRTESVFTIIQYTGNNGGLQNYFLELCAQLMASLGNEPTQLEIYTAVYRLIELLKSVSQTPLKSIQGLWAELLIIEQANNIPLFIQAWHKEPTDKYDFSYKTQHLEVKSSSRQLRQHHFSMEQIVAPLNNDLMIASVFVVASNKGMSLETLRNRIMAKIPNEFNLQHILNLTIAKTLGNEISAGLITKFNYELAIQSVVFYDSRNIPNLPSQSIPKEISDIHFKVDLTNVLSLKNFSLELTTS